MPHVLPVALSARRQRPPRERERLADGRGIAADDAARHQAEDEFVDVVVVGRAAPGAIARSSTHAGAAPTASKKSRSASGAARMASSSSSMQARTRWCASIRSNPASDSVAASANGSPSIVWRMKLSARSGATRRALAYPSRYIDGTGICAKSPPRATPSAIPVPGCPNPPLRHFRIAIRRRERGDRATLGSSLDQAARCSGVRSKSSRASTSAPAATSPSTMLGSLDRAARCRGVRPKRSRPSTSASTATFRPARGDIRDHLRPHEARRRPCPCCDHALPPILRHRLPPPPLSRASKPGGFG